MASDSPPPLPVIVQPIPKPPPAKRPPFESNALWWLVFFDAAWSVPEIVGNVVTLFLAPVCFLGAAVPVFLIQRKAGDSSASAALKAGLLGFLAALPFPVTGTAFGAAMLAWTKMRTDK